jgi:hypothetical protein
MALNADEVILFNSQISNLYTNLKSIGIKCRKNNDTYNIPEGNSYVVYSYETENYLVHGLNRIGLNNISLDYKILPKHFDRARAIVYELGGAMYPDTSTICFGYTAPDKIERLNALAREMNMTWCSKMTELVAKLGKYCIAKNFYVNDNAVHNFTKDEIDVINRNCAYGHGVEEGFMLIDKDGGKTGMVRLYSDGADPKWWFEEKVDGTMEVDYA